MVQNNSTARFLKPLSLSFVVAVAGGWSPMAHAQIVNSAAFTTAPASAAQATSTPQESANHSILIDQDDPWEQAANANNAFVTGKTDGTPSVRSASRAADLPSERPADLGANLGVNDVNRPTGFGVGLAPNPRPKRLAKPSGFAGSVETAGPKWSASPADDSSAARPQQVTDVSRSNINYDPPTPPEPSSSRTNQRSTMAVTTSAGTFGNTTVQRTGNPQFPPLRTAPTTQTTLATQTADTSQSRHPEHRPTADLHSNGTASVFDRPGHESNGSTDSLEPPYESAYLHDQRPASPANNPATFNSTSTVAGNTPAVDTFSSPATTQRLTPPHRLTQSNPSAFADQENSIQQTAFTSPASPLQPQQFQNNNSAQRNGRRGNQPAPNQNRRSFGQNASSAQPSQNQPAQRQFTDDNDNRGNTNQDNATDSSSAKSVIAKFSFDNHQQSANGLPIRLIDVLRQARNASRSQLIPQYWDVYYDWAQSISATNHRDWVASITAAKQTDAASIEVAKSSAENEITFNSIQLGKSQAKMKSLMATADPIVPMDSPTVTRVKTNYDAFKKHGLVPSRFDGVDQTLQQMYGLITSRANTAMMAQQNADQAKQLYARNQSTVDHVLTAGRTWRTAESDFIASVIEYNQAYADYALALPYGNGPVEAVIGMLIVEPSPETAAGNDTDNNRPNLSNGQSADTNLRSQSQSQTQATVNDLSIPYRSTNGNGNNRQANAASNRFSQRSSGSAAQQASTSQSMQRSGSSFGDKRSGSMPDQGPIKGFGGNSNAGFSPAASSGMSTSPGTQVRPSQFPAGSANASPSSTASPQAAASGSGSRFSGQPKSSGQSFMPFAPANNQNNKPLQPNQPSFSGQTPAAHPPAAQPPAGDRTARRANPFGSVSGSSSGGGSGSTNSSGSSNRAQPPSSTPQPPASSGFNFGG